LLLNGDTASIGSVFRDLREKDVIVEVSNDGCGGLQLVLGNRHVNLPLWGVAGTMSLRECH
jgi:hypothetical protein